MNFKHYLVLFFFIIITSLASEVSIFTYDTTLKDTDTLARTHVDTNARLIFAEQHFLETAFLIKEISLKYNPSHLNPIQSVSDYEIPFKQALNLGVYSIDLGYANLYGQQQDVLNYLMCINQLSDKLNLSHLFHCETIRQIASIRGNIDALLQVAQHNAEKMEYDLYKKNQTNLSILILAGGWIESIYLTSLTYNERNNKQLREQIAGQKQALDQILIALEPFLNDSDIALLLNDLHQLKKVYDRVERKLIVGLCRQLERNGELVIDTEPSIEFIISDADADKICGLIKSIRNKIIKI